jgi:hypothetical protein
MRPFSLLSVLCTAAAAFSNISTPLHNATLSAITDCAPTTSYFQIQDQGFGPDPPVPDANVTMWIQYMVPSSAMVEAGTSVDSVSLNGLPVSSETTDLCTIVPCPQTGGVHKASNTFLWPSGISSGTKILYTSKWFTDDGMTLLLCSKVTVIV